MSPIFTQKQRKTISFTRAVPSKAEERLMESWASSRRGSLAETLRTGPFCGSGSG